jgi:hypothetical protein
LLHKNPFAVAKDDGIGARFTSLDFALQPILCRILNSITLPSIRRLPLVQTDFVLPLFLLLLLFL